jgi:dTDP-4-amino-4,6-dideoxygalactose transaminase
MRTRSQNLQAAAAEGMSVVSKPTRVREVPHNRLTFGEAEVEAVTRTVRSGQWAQGPRVAELECELARIAKVKYCVCVASGLSALRLALGALGVTQGARVLVPAYSCVALANACLSWGAEPVPVDIESDTWNLDARRCREAVSEVGAKAVIAVNTFGAPADLTYGQNTRIPIIEDCAHAFGLDVDGRPLGGRSEIGILSFYATKLLGGGEGGAVLTNRADVFEFVNSARDYSDKLPDAHRMNDKMSDVEASLVLAQLERLPEMVAKREALALRYIDLLSSAPSGTLFRLPPWDEKRIWYRFVVEVLSEDAQQFVEELRSEGVDAALPVNDWRLPGGPVAQTADRAYRRLLSLPLYPILTEDEQDYVVSTFWRVCEERIRA